LVEVLDFNHKGFLFINLFYYESVIYAMYSCANNMVIYKIYI
jgi:hypothetical protein